MMSLFDNEAILSAYEYEIMEKGREKGREEGREEGKKEAVINLYDMGMPIEKIARAVSESEEKIKLWLCEPIVRS